MSLVITIKDAVNQIRAALGDLILDSVIYKREPLPHTPGQYTAYDDVSYDCGIVITSFGVNRTTSGFDFQEMADQPILSIDKFLIIFHDSSIIPQPNDVVEINESKFRLIKVKSVTAGSEIVLSMAHARPYQ